MDDLTDLIEIIAANIRPALAHGPLVMELQCRIADIQDRLNRLQDRGISVAVGEPDR